MEMGAVETMKVSVRLLIIILVIAPVASMSEPTMAQSCQFWVAPVPLGSDTNPGSFSQPWATLKHATETIPDNNCTVWFQEGEYVGNHRLNRRFTTLTTFKSIVPYQAVLHNAGAVVNISGGRNILLEGFVFRHSGPGANSLVFVVDRNDEGWAENIILRNNIFHDSYNNDLLKVHNGCRFITVEQNIFYNQGPSEQHIDVNSVTDVLIQDNIFFNDFDGSGRSDPGNTKAFITIKDSNEGDDGLFGSERVTLRRNIFLNWQGGSEPFIQVGNDGKPYHEAKDIQIENNLMIGNSASEVNALLAVSGARNVSFINNTVTGDLPSRAYAIRIDRKGSNPQNRDIFMYNNIWSDPSGTMGSRSSENDNKFSNGDLVDVSNLVLDNNLYWNGGRAIPPGDLVSPLVDDTRRVVANPLLNTNHGGVVLPRWSGSSFLSGLSTIREEFLRLVLLYGMISTQSPAIGMADPRYTPSGDILGRPRPSIPSLGAVEIFRWRFIHLPLNMRMQSAP
jgi:hypothetical protein